MTHATVTIQITSESKPSTLSWMGEVAAFAQILEHTGTLKVVQNQVRFARARFGHYDLIDFVAVLIGYILVFRTDPAGFLRTARSICRAIYGLVWAKSFAPSLDAFSFSRTSLIRRRWKGSGAYAQKDWLARKPFPSAGGLFDRRGAAFLVIDVDGTRQAARERCAAADRSLACSPSAV